MEESNKKQGNRIKETFFKCKRGESRAGEQHWRLKLILRVTRRMLFPHQSQQSLKETESMEVCSRASLESPAQTETTAVNAGGFLRSCVTAAVVSLHSTERGRNRKSLVTSYQLICCCLCGVCRSFSLTDLRENE